MLEEAQRQLREVGAQLAEAVGQRDAVTAQAEAAARDATNLLQLMARRAEAQPSSRGWDAAAGAEAGMRMEAQPPEQHQTSKSPTAVAADRAAPSAAEMERLEQQLQVLP